MLSTAFNVFLKSVLVILRSNVKDDVIFAADENTRKKATYRKPSDCVTNMNQLGMNEIQYLYSLTAFLTLIDSTLDYSSIVIIAKII